MDQLDVAVSAAEIVSIDAANPPVMRVRHVGQQWSNFQTLSRLTYRDVQIDVTTEEAVWIPLRGLERIIVKVVA